MMSNFEMVNSTRNFRSEEDDSTPSDICITCEDDSELISQNQAKVIGMMYANDEDYFNSYVGYSVRDHMPEILKAISHSEVCDYDNDGRIYANPTHLSVAHCIEPSDFFLALRSPRITSLKSTFEKLQESEHYRGISRNHISGYTDNMISRYAHMFNCSDYVLIRATLDDIFAPLGKLRPRLISKFPLFLYHSTLYFYSSEFERDIGLQPGDTMKFINNTGICDLINNSTFNKSLDYISGDGFKAFIFTYHNTSYEPCEISWLYQSMWHQFKTRMSKYQKSMQQYTGNLGECRIH
jgi:hypothetical protein